MIIITIDTKIRLYEKADRQFIRDLLCDTAFMGIALERLFSDRELYADILTNYYLLKEPESCLVAEQAGERKGYLTGCKKPEQYNHTHLFFAPTIIKGMFKLLTMQYDSKALSLAKWYFTEGYKQKPKEPDNSAHLHINVTKDSRAKGVGRMLINAFEEQLLESKIQTCHLNVITSETLGAKKFFEKVGFQEYDRVEFTMMSKILNEKTHLYTMVKKINA